MRMLIMLKIQWSIAPPFQLKFDLYLKAEEQNTHLAMNLYLKNQKAHTFKNDCCENLQIFKRCSIA